MNALGVDYGSSSDDDGSERAASPPTSTAAVVAQSSQQLKKKNPASREITIEGLPAEPPGAADPEVTARIARFMDMQKAPGAKSFQQNLQTKKEVANPYILHKVVEYFGIDELQSNFDRAVFDPYGLPLHEYSEKIAIGQKRRQDERMQQQQQRSQIAFTQAKQTE